MAAPSPTKRTAAALAGLLGLLSAACAGTPASVGLSVSAPAASAATPMASVRELFLQALQQAQQPAPGTDDTVQDPAALQAAPEPQLDSRIDAFVRAHAGQPVVHDLTHDWLVSLAARGRWDWFLPRASAVSDPLLLCQRLNGQLAVGEVSGTAAAPWEAEALALWGQPQQQPSACDAVFERLQQQGLLTPERVEARVRAALRANNVALALQLAAGLPKQQAAPLLQWARLLQSPASTLRSLVKQPHTPVEALALQAGFHRLALRDSAAAAALLPGLSARPAMTRLLRGELRRDAALGLAYD